VLSRGGCEELEKVIASQLIRVAVTPDPAVVAVEAPASPSARANRRGAAGVLRRRGTLSRRGNTEKALTQAETRLIDNVAFRG